MLKDRHRISIRKFIKAPTTVLIRDSCPSGQPIILTVTHMGIDTDIDIDTYIDINRHTYGYRHDIGGCQNMVLFGVLNITWHLVFSGPKKGP